MTSNKREYTKKYYEKNKEKILKQQKKYKEKNKEKIKEYRKKYYQEKEKKNNKKEVKKGK